MRCAATLAVAAALVCLISAQSSCPDGWLAFSVDGGAPTCLYFLQSKNSWAATRAYCTTVGGDLAKLTGDLHHTVIEYINDHSDLDDEGFWLGGTDMVMEGSWKWVVDNTNIPLGTPHWYACSDQPSGGDDKNCLCLFTPDLYFHSCTCEKLYYGICQL